MPSWGDGYITDIEYTDGFYEVQGPRRLSVVTLMRGVEAPDFDQPFTYCELGCGRGRTSLVLAAVHPEAEFHAVDFHPAHIAQAQHEARAAGLKNVRFYENSFEELLGPHAPPLPMFDVVTLHGVWSWISPESQAAILAFLKARLKPGGLVLVSYNAMPLWSQAAPLQRFMKELADASPSRSDIAAERAAQTVGALFDVGVIPRQFEPGVTRIRGHVERGQLEYLAHEYLNAHWRPVYHLDVARAMQVAKLSYAGSSDLLRNFPILGMSAEQRAALADIHDEALRESLTDLCLGSSFRSDVYVRGARRQTVAAVTKRAAALELMSIGPFPDVVQMQSPDGAIWRPNPEVYDAVGKALAKGPARVGDLLANAPTSGPPVGPVELIGVLVALGLAAVHNTPSAEAVAASNRLNDLLPPPGESSMTDGVTLALPAISSGLQISASEYTLLWAARRGAVDVDMAAREFVARCRRAGGHAVIDNKAYEDDDEAVRVAAAKYQEKLDRLAPVWRTMGLL